ncbi:MAG: hypothetical protein MOP51_2621 [Citricoccus sp.]|nr:hypothetical protein [Citricoccus sp. WCRC_4]
MTSMEQQKTYDPDRTVTINAGRGLSAGFVLVVLGFLVSLVAVVGIGLTSFGAMPSDPGSASSAEQEIEADSP